MKTLNELKKELKSIIEKYVNDFEYDEFCKNNPDQDTELKYCNGRVYYKNVDLVSFLFDNGNGYEYGEFIESYNEFMKNGCVGVLGYYEWIDEEIRTYDFKLNHIVHRYNKVTNEEEKESIEDELCAVFSGDYKGFFSDDITETYDTYEVIDIVVAEMIKYPFLMEEFVKDYYYAENYNFTNLIKLGKEYGLFTDYDCNDED